jgi:hypothetical protein
VASASTPGERPSNHPLELAVGREEDAQFCDVVAPAFLVYIVALGNKLAE